MKGTGLPWLTEVLGSPRTLSDSAAAGESIFPLRKRQYPVGSPRFPLPRTADVSRNVQHVIANTTLVGLTPGQSRWLWGDFFENPAMVGEVQPSSDERAKIPVTVTAKEELRRVVLCSVYRHPEELVQHRPRLAVLGQLTILKDKNRNTATDSWFEVSLHTTTRGLQSALEGIPGIRVDGARGASRLQIVIAESYVKKFEASRSVIERAAWVAGINPELLLADAGRYANVTASLASKATKHALFIGSFSNAVLYEEFVKARGPESAVQFPTGLIPGTDEFLNAFRETAARLAGSGSDLTVYETPQPPLPPARPVMPVKNPKDCLHKDDFVYVLDAESNLWWTRDLTGHGGVVFKTYTQRDRILYHQAERDEKGVEIPDKYKGASGLSVKMTDHSPCGMLGKKDHVK